MSENIKGKAIINSGETYLEFKKTFFPNSLKKEGIICDIKSDMKSNEKEREKALSLIDELNLK